MKDSIKKFIDCYIPTETCNLRCHYCYITQKRKFNNKLAKFKYDAKYIRKALSKERLGGPCLFNICAGGETLLIEEILDVVKELLEEGHYVMIVTNGTINKRFEQIAQFDKKLLNHLFFKFSFHYLELIRLKKLDDFFDNVNRIKKAGASFTIEITPNDELIPYREEVMKICEEKLGVLCHLTIGRKDVDNIPVLTDKTFEEYIEIWNPFKSNLFDFKSQIFGKKRNEFCYAGDWSMYINLVTGDVTQCHIGMKIDNIYKNIERPIKTLAIGNNCPQPHCYNGHAFLALGCIPELDTPTYDTLRNRKNDKNEEWLTEDMKEFMKTKLKDSNQEYSKTKKLKVNAKNKIYKIPKDIKGVAKKILKK